MLLKVARIITGDGETVIEDGAILMEGAIIVGIGTFEELQKKNPGEQVREYPDGTLMPGFIDMHVHIGSAANVTDLNDFTRAYLAADYAAKAFGKGVTTIRDVGSAKNLCASMVRATQNGTLKLPRIIHTDAAICFTGGHGWQGGVEADGPWQVRAAIRDAVKRGANWIKIMSSHRSDTPEYTQEELNAAVDECHRVNKKVAVHAGTQPSIQMAIDAGFDTIEHGTWLTVDQAKQMKEKGMVWVPTIVAYTFTHQRIVKAMNSSGVSIQESFVQHHAYFRDAAACYHDNFGQLYQAGVEIVTGTDVVYPGREVTPVQAEMKFFVEYGMPVIKAIEAATLTGARTLEMADRFGEIACGKQADLQIVKGNPLKEIAAIDDICEVFYAGESVYRCQE